MSLRDTAEAAPSASELVEDWLRQVIHGGVRSVEQIALAMAEDGFPAHQARLFAAVALLRYAHVPVLDLLEHQAARTALASCREELGSALEEYHQGRAVQLSGSLLDPRRMEANDRPCGVASAALAVVCHHPRIAHFRGVLTDEECSALIELARPRLRASETVNYTSGARGVEAQRRSSRTAFLAVEETDLSRAVARRVAKLIDWPVSHCEDLAVTHYLAGAEFVRHVDYFEDLGELHLGEDGQRVATVVLYLNDVEAGGATAFPALGIEFYPHRGSALYFSYQMADGSFDPASEHAGLPVLRGEKWIVTLWFHERACPT